VSEQNVHDTPNAGLILVDKNAEREFVSVFTAVLTRSVLRLYCVVIRRRRRVNDCIKACPMVSFVLRHSTLKLSFIHEKRDGI
jgi:hypothetical protein